MFLNRNHAKDVHFLIIPHAYNFPPLLLTWQIAFCTGPSSPLSSGSNDATSPQDSFTILQLHHLSCHPHVWSFPSFVFSTSVISPPHGSLERGKQAGWTLACKAWPLPDVYSPRQFNQSVPAGPIRGAASVWRIRYILKWICYSLITPLRLVSPSHLQCNMKI